MALFSYPVCTWLCQYVNMGVRKWLEKSAEKQKYKMRKTANPLSRKAFRAVSFSATKDSLGALKSKDFKAPLLFSAFVFPYCFPFRLSRHRSDVGIHPIRAVLLHLCRHMAVDIQGKGCGVVAQVALDGLDVISRL